MGSATPQSQEGRPTVVPPPQKKKCQTSYMRTHCVRNNNQLRMVFKLHATKILQGPSRKLIIAVLCFEEGDRIPAAKDMP